QKKQTNSFICSKVPVCKRICFISKCISHQPIDVSNIIEKGYEQGLLMVNAGTNVIRFVPPLIIEKSNVDNLVEKLTTIFSA
ncbi:MAG: aminotransferase class III-fold pyridoxal phosphate-dependent enzyme, partial [Chloroflexota bacterium]